MTEAALIALTAVVLGWTLLSEWFAARNLTGPLVFLVAGLVLANPSWGIVGIDVESSTIHVVAEITLALLLFGDASAVPLSAARDDLPLTLRLLAIGLPLSIVAGTALALLAFPSLPLALAGLLAASLAPTDAALSASVLSDERLPVQVRRVLNVESGLNDGIATPVVTFCIAAAATVIGATGVSHESGLGALGELAIGAGIGAGIAVGGARMLALAHQMGWIGHGSRRLAALSLALLTFLVASEAGGNPFVSAFVGGLAFGTIGRSDAVESVDLAEVTELTELTGQVLSLVLWFTFGAAFVLPAFEALDVRIVAYAVASLTVVRMVPVAIAFLGAGQSLAATAFVGWFGPRGLASVVFALLAVEGLGATHPDVVTVVHTIAVAIVLSIVAHGITARPLATRYLTTLGGPPPPGASASEPQAAT